MKRLLIAFLDDLRDYEREAGKSLANDERESEEIVDIFLNSGGEENSIQAQAQALQIYKSYYYNRKLRHRIGCGELEHILKLEKSLYGLDNGDPD